MSRHEAFIGEAAPISGAELISLSDGNARHVDDLFQHWLDQIVELKRAQRLLATCIAKMPWWAQPGPTTLHSDGRLSGPITWTPALQEFELPTGMVMRVIRPGEYDFRQHYLDNPLMRPEQRQTAFDKAMSRLKDREAAAALECERSGTASARRIEIEHGSRLYRFADAIEKTTPSPSRLAFRAIEALAAEADGDVPFSKQVDATRDFTLNEHGHTLKNLIPVLPPRLREQAERAVRPGAGPMRKWICWHGETPRRSGFGRPPAELLVRKPEGE